MTRLVQALQDAWARFSRNTSGQYDVFIDALEPGSIRGWIRNRDSIEPLVIDIDIAGRHRLESIDADCPRPDVAAATGTHGNFGFHARFDKPLPDGDYRIRIHDVRMGDGRPVFSTTLSVDHAAADEPFDLASPGGSSGTVPHYGRILQRMVEAATARMKPEGSSREYDTIRSGFDVAYYLVRYPDIANGGRIDPVEHYIRSGARERRDPSPHFSTRQYVARYPEVAKSKLNPFHHWLTIGREKGYVAEAFAEFDAMCEMLGQQPAEVHRLLTEKRRDLRARLEHGVLGEMVARAAELEPLVAHSWDEAFQAKLPPFHSDAVVSSVVAIHRLQQAARFQRAKVVVVVNRPRWGGGRRMEGHILHALSGRYAPGEMIVINTDVGGELPAGRFPAGCRHVDLASVVMKLGPETSRRLLVEFIRSLRPEMVFNVNSRLLWEALGPYGKALSASVPVFACLFCNDQTRLGYWTGYPAKQFYRHFDVLAGVLCDSHYLADELRSRFRVPPGQRRKVAVLEAPVDASRAPATAPVQHAQRRPQVFWSGRLDRQKRLDVVYALARRMPDVDFRTWGEGRAGSDVSALPHPGNVIFEGKYANFDALPIDDCDAWLYTSEWDGVPGVLLEVSMTGVPLVGSLAGGTGEILREGLSWPIADVDDVDAYEAAIREVLSDPGEARRRALRLREYLVQRRTTDKYVQALQDILPGGESDEAS